MAAEGTPPKHPTLQPFERDGLRPSREGGKLAFWRRAARWGIALGFLAVIFALAAHVVIAPLHWHRRLPVVIPFAAGVILILLGIVANYRWLGSGLLRKRTVVALNVAAMIVLAAFIVVIGNLMVSRHFKRYDLTQKGIFTLSSQTRNLLAALPREVKATALFGEEADPLLQWIRRRLRDLLEEYAANSPKFKFKAINIDRDPTGAQEFLATVKTKPSRDSIVFQCGDDVRQVIWSEMVEASYDFMSGAQSMQKFKGEQALTTALKAVVMEKRRAICFTTGHGEKAISDTDQETGYSSIVQSLERENYKVESLNLRAAGSVPDDCAVLVIAGPQSPFAEEELNAIRRHLSNNGGLLVMLEPQYMHGVSKGLAEILRDCNIVVRDDAVILSALRIAGAVKLLPLAFGETYTKHPVTRDVGTYATIFSYACALNTLPSTAGRERSASWRTSKLIQTSRETWGETKMHDEAARSRYDPREDIAGPLALVVAAQATEPPRSPYDPSKESQGARIVAIGDSDFATNGLVRNSPGNPLLMISAVSWLDQKGLPPAQIPAEDLDLRPLTKWDSQTARMVLLICTASMPAAAIIFGVFVWFMRRK